MTSFYEIINIDEHVKSRQNPHYVIPAKAGIQSSLAKAGIQSFKLVLDPGACPGPDPGFAGETTITVLGFCL